MGARIVVLGGRGYEWHQFLNNLVILAPRRTGRAGVLWAVYSTVEAGADVRVRPVRGGNETRTRRRARLRGRSLYKLSFPGVAVYVFSRASLAAFLAAMSVRCAQDLLDRMTSCAGGSKGPVPLDLRCSSLVPGVPRCTAGATTVLAPYLAPRTYLYALYRHYVRWRSEAEWSHSESALVARGGVA